MEKSEMIRLLTAFCNFHTFKTIDEFSGDYMMTLEEGEKVLAFLESLGMKPPSYRKTVLEEDGPLRGVHITKTFEGWEDEEILQEERKGKA
jgi:hypothetical protein